MTRIWPDTLPGIILPDNGLTPIDPSRRTQMEVGPKRARRITFARGDTVKANWLFTDTEFAAFRAWYGEEDWSLTGASDDLSGWNPVRLTLSPNYEPGPAGQLADRLVEDTSANSRFERFVLPSVTDNKTVCMAASLKAGERSKARIGLRGRDSVTRYLSCDLATGVVFQESGLLTSSVIDRKNGWWRLQIKADVSAGIETPQARIYILDDAGTGSYAGDGVSGLSVCEVNVRESSGHDLFLPTAPTGAAYGAAGGSAWFKVKLPFGGGFKTVQSKFEGPFDARLSGQALQWRVAAALETRDA